MFLGEISSSRSNFYKKDYKGKKNKQHSYKQGRRRRKLLDDLKERRGHSHLKEEDLDCTMWRARFGRVFRPVIRQTTKRMNEMNMMFVEPSGAL